jgi:hypothetical protein
MAPQVGGGHRGCTQTGMMPYQMTGFRRVIAWLLITLVVLSLVGTLIVGEAS